VSPFSSRILDKAPGLEALVLSLSQNTNQLRSRENFPSEMVSRCARFEAEWTDFQKNTLTYYVAIAFGCLTTAFIMTQRHAAIRRIESSDHASGGRWLREIRSGQYFATVGISHLTTSRRHLSNPPVRAQRADRGQRAEPDQGDGERWILNGCIPWVTGAFAADYIVIGAVESLPIGDETLPQKENLASQGSIDATKGIVAECSHENRIRELLFLLPKGTSGVKAGKGMELLALNSSCTDEVHLDSVELSRRHLLHGPCENVMAASQSKLSTSGAGAGGAQTSALALGLAARAIDWMYGETKSRPNLQPYAESLANSWTTLFEKLVSIEQGDASIDSNTLRKHSNDLALQSTQAALAAAKGSGFLENHPVSRWCREAMFFLVWSCPQWVADAHLCSFSSMDANLQ